MSIFILDKLYIRDIFDFCVRSGGDFSMIRFRDNKLKRTMSHEMVTVAVRPSLAVCATRMKDLVIVAGWRKEAAP